MRFRNLTALLFFTILFGLPAASPLFGDATPYVPAEECAKCHPSIYKYWSESSHAKAVQSALFPQSLKRALDLSTDATRTKKECVGCHSPTTQVTGDLELSQAVSRQGVTCDFCHTVKDVDLSRGWPPFQLDPGPVKRGPFAYSKPFKGHEAEYSALHRAKPLLCAGCHEFTNSNGLRVLTTYTEWKESPYSGRGVSCQDCHMALVPGTKVKEGLEQSAPGARLVNLHRLVGGTSEGQLNRGLDLKFDSVTVTGTSANVRVMVSNSGAGHRIPGGLPTKSLVLVVSAAGDAGDLGPPQERVYRRELRDAKDNPVKGLAETFMRAKSEGEDTRLRPLETRTEQLTLQLPQASRAVVARLEYRDASDASAPPKVSVISQVRWELKGR
jgi:cytochrome c554/c'-like protein